VVREGAHLFITIQYKNVRCDRIVRFISGVIDPRNGQGISLKQAVSLGIINQRGGRYINPQTRESIPISAAMNSGKIQVNKNTVTIFGSKYFAGIGSIILSMCRPTAKFYYYIRYNIMFNSGFCFPYDYSYICNLSFRLGQNFGSSFLINNSLLARRR